MRRNCFGISCKDGHPGRASWTTSLIWTGLIWTGLIWKGTDARMASVTTARNDLAFEAARRHSFIVRSLRILLPLVIVLAGLGFAGSVLWKRTFDFGPVAFDSLTISDGALVMENPRMSGIDRNERSYRLSALTASQKLGQSDLVDLTGINASLAVDPKNDARILSQSGIFNQAEETLLLYDGVNVATTSGYVVKLRDADVDLNEGIVTSDKPLTIEMLNGTLDAKGVRITERGELITFTGRVNMLMQVHGRDGQLETDQ